MKRPAVPPSAPFFFPCRLPFRAFLRTGLFTANRGNAPPSPPGASIDFLHADGNDRPWRATNSRGLRDGRGAGRDSGIDRAVDERTRGERRAIVPWREDNVITGEESAAGDQNTADSDNDPDVVIDSSVHGLTIVSMENQVRYRGEIQRSVSRDQEAAESPMVPSISFYNQIVGRTLTRHYRDFSLSDALIIIRVIRRDMKSRAKRRT